MHQVFKSHSFIKLSSVTHDNESRTYFLNFNPLAYRNNSGLPVSRMHSERFVKHETSFSLSSRARGSSSSQIA